MTKVTVVHNSGLNRKCEISSYLHCGRCLREKPKNQNPAQWARLNVGLTPDGHIQVWCERHNVNVDLMQLTTEPVAGVKVTNDCGHED